MRGISAESAEAPFAGLQSRNDELVLGFGDEAGGFVFSGVDRQAFDGGLGFGRVQHAVPVHILEAHVGQCSFGFADAQRAVPVAVYVAEFSRYFSQDRPGQKSEQGGGEFQVTSFHVSTPCTRCSIGLSCQENTRCCSSSPKTKQASGHV